MQRCKWAFPATHQKLQFNLLKLLVRGREGPLAPLHPPRWQIPLFLCDPGESCWASEDANLHPVQGWLTVEDGYWTRLPDATLLANISTSRASETIQCL